MGSQRGMYLVYNWWVEHTSTSISSIFAKIPALAILLFSGVVGGLALTVPLLWPLIFVFLVPLFHRVYKKDTSATRAFFYGWIFGYGLIGVAIHWTFNAYPLDWAGVADPVHGLIMTTIVWFVISLTLSFFVALWALIAHFLIRRSVVDMISVPISWVLFEWLRMWGFTLVTWGTGSVFTPYFSFGMIGYALGESPALLQIARFGGVYLLSFCVAFVGMLLLVISNGTSEILTRRRALALAAALLAAYVILIFIPYRPPHAMLNITTIETDFPATVTVSDAALSAEESSIKTKLSAIAGSGDTPDVIVLPEDTRFLQTMGARGEDPQKYLQSLFGAREVLLIDSARTDTFTGSYSRVTFFSSTRGSIATRDKYVIIPFGEFVPTVMEWGMHAVGMGSELALDESNRDYFPGPTPHGVEYHGATLIVLLCSEMIAPSLYHDTARGTTNPIFINMSSQSDFHHGSDPFAEMRDMMLVQSAWSNVPFFQSTNGEPMVRIER